MAHANPDTYAALGTNHDDSYSDGPFLETATGQVVTLKDSIPVAWHDKGLTCEIFEDFLGGAFLGTSTLYIKDDTSAGTPTKAVLSGANSGQLELTFAANDEAEYLGVYANDVCNIDPTAGPIFTCRVKTTATPLATDTLVFGLASARNDTKDSVASNAWFRIQGANYNLLVESDNGTTDNDDDDTGIDLTADTFIELRVDASNYADVKFYYRSTLGAEWTDITPSGVTYALNATANVQPFIEMQKSGGAGQTAMFIDYVHCVWKRQ